MDFALVRPGTFVMGDAKEGDNDEKPEHRVRITQPFYLGRYPVTQAQWRAVMGGNPADFAGDDQRPVESVSWEDIVGSREASPGFLARLSPVPGYAYRLPTEAEWEYAAKGGHLAPPPEVRSGAMQVQVADSYPTYAGGEDVNAAAWQDRNNGYSTLRTGYRQPNVLGLYGMSGNVYEWCRDTFDSEIYTKRSRSDQDVIDPLVEDSGRRRVVRGGSWIRRPGRCRPAYRATGIPRSGFASLASGWFWLPVRGSEGRRHFGAGASGALARRPERKKAVGPSGFTILVAGAPAFGQNRVVRGGSWINDPRNCRPAYRNNRHPTNRNRNYGFRLVLAPSSRCCIRMDTARTAVGSRSVPQRTDEKWYYYHSVPVLVTPRWARTPVPSYNLTTP